MAYRKTKCPYCGIHGLVPIDKKTGLIVCHSCKKQYDLSTEGDTSAAIGLIGGALVGASIGGPVGAIVGGIAGLIFGKSGKGLG